MKIVLPFKDHHCIILPRMQFFHKNQNIMKYTSKDFRIYCGIIKIIVHCKIQDKHHKIFNIHHSVFAYTSQDIEHTSNNIHKKK